MVLNHTVSCIALSYYTHTDSTPMETAADHSVCWKRGFQYSSSSDPFGAHTFNWDGYDLWVRPKS